MAKTHIVKFRVTKKQHEELIIRAKWDNKRSVSEYLRNVALSHPYLYNKSCENNELLKEILSLAKSNEKIL